MSQQEAPPPMPLGVVGRSLLGAYMAVVSVLLGYFILVMWPTARPDASGNVPPTDIVFLGKLVWHNVSPEVRLIVLVMAVGALGSYVHAATSFADFVGNRRIYRSWAWWYVLRAFIGAALAVLFYFVIRGGLLSGGAAAQDVSPFGIAAVAGLVGMFSKQATDKLSELAVTVFKTEKPAQRGDRLSGP